MKKNLSKLFTVKRRITVCHRSALALMQAERIHGTIRFREVDDVSGETIAEYYIGELVAPLAHNSYGVIEHRGTRARCRYTAKSFDEALSFINDIVCKNGVRYPIFTMGEIAQLS